jgi:hypothetical protein
MLFICGYFDVDGTMYYHKNKNQKPGIRINFIGTKDF